MQSKNEKVINSLYSESDIRNRLLEYARDKIMSFPIIDEIQVKSKQNKKHLDASKRKQRCRK